MRLVENGLAHLPSCLVFTKQDSQLEVSWLAYVMDYAETKMGWCITVA